MLRLNALKAMAAAMIAAAAVGCSLQGGLEEETGEEATQYDAKGRRLVSFSVPTRTYESTMGGGAPHGP